MLITEVRKQAREESNLAKFKGIARQEQVDFDLGNGLQAKAAWNGGDISGLGGLAFLALADYVTGFIEGAAKCIKDKRAQNQIRHSVEQLLKQVVYLCSAGFPDGIDSSHFKGDPMLRLCLGWSPNGEDDAASAATISRFMTERSERDLKRLFSYLIAFYIRKHARPPKEIQLDLDGTSVEAHGNQQFISYNGHYEVNMYYPLMVIDGEGWLIAPILRPGHVADANIAVDVLKLLCKRLRRAWPDVKILVRADSAFNDPKIMDWCEDNNCDYLLGLKSDNSLNTGSKQFDKSAEKRFARKHGEKQFDNSTGAYQENKTLRDMHELPGEDRYKAIKKHRSREIRMYGEFQHRVGEGYGGKHKRWRKERRVISSSKVNDRGLKRRYIATSLKHYTPDKIYTEIYAARGRAELVIKGVKELGASKLSSFEAKTNQFRLLIFTMAYNLIRLVQENLRGSFANANVETIIREVIRIPVQVQVSTRRIWLRWTSSWPHQKVLSRLGHVLAEAQARSG